MNDSHNKITKSATFVLVHGAWAGGWDWLRVTPYLTAKGHHVYAPTLSGLGERSHLASETITLSTHIQDIVNEIKYKDLDAVVLVGHSYAGFVITGVAELIPERIASIVYLDAFIPEDNQAFVDIASWIDTSAKVVDAPPTSPGDYLEETDRTWVDSKATAQPIGTFTEKLRVTGAYQRVPKKTFIRATGWDGPFDDAVSVARADPSWQVYEIVCGHDVPIDKPKELATMLESVS
jgi:pimeloyl-ACP methyl ester carboxylesterase